MRGSASQQRFKLRMGIIKRAGCVSQVETRARAAVCGKLACEHTQTGKRAERVGCGRFHGIRAGEGLPHANGCPEGLVPVTRRRTLSKNGEAESEPGQQGLVGGGGLGRAGRACAAASINRKAHARYFVRFSPLAPVRSTRTF
jgi:hypothetical protein